MGKGHMDMSFANQSLSVKYMKENQGSIAVGVHPVPRDVDTEVSRLKLAAMAIDIDELTPEQKHYMSSWSEGT